MNIKPVNSWITTHHFYSIFVVYVWF